LSNLEKEGKKTRPRGALFCDSSPKLATGERHHNRKGKVVGLTGEETSNLSCDKKKVPGEKKNESAQRVKQAAPELLFPEEKGKKLTLHLLKKKGGT